MRNRHKLHAAVHLALALLVIAALPFIGYKLRAAEDQHKLYLDLLVNMDQEHVDILKTVKLSAPAGMKLHMCFMFEDGTIVAEFIPVDAP